MNRRFLITGATAVAIVAAGPAWATLAVGAKAPDFTLKVYQNGEASQFSMAAARAKGPVVLFFFPGAFTAGCNVEAKEFADAAAKFKAVGATVVGVTGGFGNSDRRGSTAANLDEAVRDFSKEHCQGQFPVVVASAEVITAYDSALTQRPGWSNRTSYVVAPDGKIILAHANMTATGHVEATLKAITDWRVANPMRR